MDEATNTNTGLQRLLEKHNGSWEKVAETLYGENYQTRERRRQVESELAELKGKVPDGDSVVISADDNKLLQQLKEFGEPEQIKAQLDSAQKAISERDELVRRETVRAMLPQGFHSDAVLELLPSDATLEKDGDEIVVRKGDEKQPLEQWADSMQQQKPYILLRAQETDTRPTFTKQAPRQEDGGTSQLSKLFNKERDRRFGGNRGKDSN
jgi:hypothetical protein